MFVWVCFLLSISCFCAGAELKTERPCHGSEVVIPPSSIAMMPKIIFKPSYPLGSPRILVLDNFTLRAPRYKFAHMTLTIPDVTEKDNGIFSVMEDDEVGSTYNFLRLQVIDCSSKVVLTYGSTFYQFVSSQAWTLDFLPLDTSSKPVVLLNKTNDQVAIEGMGEMDGSAWSIKRVTQKHQGYYTFRKYNERFLSRKKLEVKEHVERYTLDTGERLIVSFALDSEQCNLDFYQEEDSEDINLIEKGRVIYDDKVVILGRGAHFSFAINFLEESDSGKYELRDQDNNLALVVVLKVKPLNPWKIYVSAGGIVLLLVSFCCCLRKCCCKRNATKRNDSSGQVVLIHQAEIPHMTSQPSGPSHPSPRYFQSYAREPVVTMSPAAPSGPVHLYQSTPPAPTPPTPYPSSNDTTAPEEQPHPQVYNPTGVDPPSFPLVFGCSSSESETQFKLPQRLNFHTALFPSTDLSSSEYVYNSDKLAL